jgi:hypothetical protein
MIIFLEYFVKKNTFAQYKFLNLSRYYYTVLKHDVSNGKEKEISC